jgi:hypothetical protein
MIGSVAHSRNFGLAHTRPVDADAAVGAQQGGESVIPLRKPPLRETI